MPGSTKNVSEYAGAQSPDTNMITWLSMHMFYRLHSVSISLPRQSENYREVFEECAKRIHWSCLASCRNAKDAASTSGGDMWLKHCISECQTKICRNSHPVRSARENALVERQIDCLNEHCLEAHKACMLKRCLAD